MVDASNDLPMKEDQLPSHLEIIHLGLFPLVLLTVAALLCGGLVGGGLVYVIAHWLGWCR